MSDKINIGCRCHLVDMLEIENKKLRYAHRKIIGCSGSVTGCFSKMKDISLKALEATK